MFARPPGSGISHTSYLFKNDDDEKEKESEKEERSSDANARPGPRAKRSLKEHATSPWGFFLFVFIVLFFIYFGAAAFGLLPPNLVTDFLQTLAHWARQAGL